MHLSEHKNKGTVKPSREIGAGAPDETQWLRSIPDADPMFIGIVGLPNDVKVTLEGSNHIPLGSGETFSHPKDKS